MKLFLKFLFIFMLISFNSCEDVIEVDLETAEPRLVIDASIDWVKNTSGNEQTIKLTTTTSYYSEVIPPVSGAEIFVTNSSNTVFHFIENSGTGEYICTDFEPEIGESYVLTIQLGGEVYTATETLIAVPEIEETIIQNNAGGFAGDEIEITYYYQDDPLRNNYYLYSVNNPRVAFPNYSVENDENNQGSLTPVYYSHKDLTQGDVLNLKLYGISRRYHDYFKKLLNASGNDDNPFSTVPTLVRGNIVNQSNSENYAFGYFRLSEVSEREFTIQ